MGEEAARGGRSLPTAANPQAMNPRTTTPGTPHPGEMNVMSGETAASANSLRYPEVWVTRSDEPLAIAVPVQARAS